MVVQFSVSPVTVDSSGTVASSSSFSTLVPFFGSLVLSTDEDNVRLPARRTRNERKHCGRTIPPTASVTFSTAVLRKHLPTDNMVLSFPDATQTLKFCSIKFENSNASVTTTTDQKSKIRRSRVLIIVMITTTAPLSRIAFLRHVSVTVPADNKIKVMYLCVSIDNISIVIYLYYLCV